MTSNEINEGYGIYTRNTLWLSKDIRDVCNAMQIPDPFCEIFSAPTFEEATMIMHQWYPHHFWVLPFNRGFQPLQMKQSGEFALTRQSYGMIPVSNTTPVAQAPLPAGTSSFNPASDSMPYAGQGVSVPMSYAPNSEQIMPAYNGVWSLTCAQGMAVFSNREKVIKMLSSPKCLYVHAVKWPTPQAASKWAWREYVTRFFQRNDANTVRINLPTRYLQDGEYFFDKNYDAREANRKENPQLEKLKSFGIC